MKTEQVSTTSWTLASRSPERKAILTEDLGIQVSICPVDFDETPILNETPQSLVERLAVGKARAFGGGGGGGVMAADTVVVFRDEILGNPKDRAEAKSMLSAMSGADIEVWTGTALGFPDGTLRTNVAMATLKMKVWNDLDLNQYLVSGLWEQCAGAFSVFHQPSPVKIDQGQLDVVRGINGAFIIMCLRDEDW
jgi:septum formation protein